MAGLGQECTGCRTISVQDGVALSASRQNTGEAPARRHHSLRFEAPKNYFNPSNRTAFSFRISGRTSSRIGSFSKSASQRSGVSNG